MTKKIVLLVATALLLLPMVIPGRSFEITREEIEAANDPIEIIKRVADKRGIAQEDMLAISHQESLLGKIKVGDEGCSLGYFHINTCVHVAAIKIIGDVRAEAEWVSDRLEEYGYIGGSRRKAIAMYNAPANPNWNYADQVEGRKKFIEKYVDKGQQK